MKAAWKAFMIEIREEFMIETMKEMGRNYKYNGKELETNLGRMLNNC